MKGLLQLRVLGLGFFQDGDVGAGILRALGLLRVRHSLAQKLVAQGRVLEVGLGGERVGSGRQCSSKIVDRELVYNDELTADSGRLTQR